jgi:hypothetical protein
LTMTSQHHTIFLLYKGSLIQQRKKGRLPAIPR